MNMTGIMIHERVQPKVGISPASNRREIITAYDTNIRVPMQLLVDAAGGHPSVVSTSLRWSIPFLTDQGGVYDSYSLVFGIF